MLVFVATSTKEGTAASVVNIEYCGEWRWLGFRVDNGQPVSFHPKHVLYVGLQAVIRDVDIIQERYP